MSKLPKVAYFCMEYAIESNVKLYAGGLGILAGDYMKEACDNDYPVIGIGIKWKQGYGEQLMKRIERRARKIGVKRLFVLTTRTEHWFVERGFKLGTVDDLPARKRDMYNYQRRSKVLFKTL